MPDLVLCLNPILQCMAIVPATHFELLVSSSSNQAQQPLRIWSGICCVDHDHRMLACTIVVCSPILSHELRSEREALATQSPKTSVARGRVRSIVPVLVAVRVTLVFEWNARACGFANVERRAVAAELHRRPLRQHRNGRVVRGVQIHPSREQFFPPTTVSTDSMPLICSSGTEK